MRKLIFFLLLAVCIPRVSLADISREEAVSLFVQGNLSYREGNYDRAVEQYEQIISRGRASAAGYFNLANTYYRKGELGLAILNYERARRISPRDSDIIFNHNYVLARANLFDGRIGTSFFQRAAEEHMDFYSIEEMLGIIIFVFFAAGGIHLLSLYRRWPARTRNVCLGFLFLVLVIFAGGLIFRLQRQAAEAVVINSTDARFEPKEDATAHYSLPQGSRVKVLKQEGGWARISRPDGRQGWVPRGDVEKI